MTGEHDAWRRRVIIGSSSRYQMKCVYFSVWNAVFRNRKFKRETRDIQLVSLFDKISVSSKVEVFFYWFRMTNIDKRYILLLKDRQICARRCVLNMWLYLSVQHRKKRESRDFFRLSFLFKSFRIRLNLFVKRKIIQTDLSQKEHKMHVWRLWMLLCFFRHQYCEFQLEKRRFRSIFSRVFHSWQTLRMQKLSISSRVELSMKKVVWSSWRLVTIIIHGVNIRCMRLCLHEFHQKVQLVTVQFFFVIWRKNSSKLRNLSLRVLRHQFLINWHKRCQNKQQGLLMIRTINKCRIRRNLRIHFTLLLTLFWRIQKCLLMIKINIMKRSIFGLKQIKCREKRNERVFSIFVLNFSRNKFAIFLSHWHVLFVCKRKAKKGCQYILHEWSTIARSEHIERRRADISEIFDRRKILSNGWQKWILEQKTFQYIKSVKSIEISKFNLFRNFWKLWQSIRLVLRFERGRWKRACEHRIKFVCKTVSFGWNFLVKKKVQKLKKREEKIAVLNSKILPRYFNEFICYQREKLRQNRSLKKVYIGKLVICSKKLRNRNCVINKFLKLKFFTKWITYNCHNRWVCMFRKKKLFIHWKEWIRMMKINHRANDFRRIFVLKFIFGSFLKNVSQSHKIEQIRLIRERSMMLSVFAKLKERMIFEEKLKLAKKSFQYQIIKKGIGQLISSLSIHKDKQENEFLTCIVNRRFLLGKRVARRWKKMCLRRKIREKIFKIKQNLALLGY